MKKFEQICELGAVGWDQVLHDSLGEEFSIVLRW